MQSIAQGDYRAQLAQLGASHWWTAGMRRITWAFLGAVGGRLLDVGCGPGWELSELPAGAWGVGVELAVQWAHYRPLVQADAGRLPFAAASFDLVLALDLFEQRGVGPMQVLAEIARVLRPGGRFMVRVPAHPWLFGPHDEYWGGARRYRRAELAGLVAAVGLTIHRLTYANAFTFPLAAVSRLLGRLGLLSGDDLRPLPPAVNRALLQLLTWEARWLRAHDLPIGLSLLCLAEKRF